jgi:hypothetical protein
VEVDGSLIERVAADKDFAATEPVVTFRLNGQEFEELFNVSDEALQALADFLDGGESPPGSTPPSCSRTGSSTCISRSRRVATARSPQLAVRRPFVHELYGAFYYSRLTGEHVFV